jgi:hypothetical protein
MRLRGHLEPPASKGYRLSPRRVLDTTPHGRDHDPYCW